MSSKSSTQHQFRNLRIDAVDRNPGQPRKHFDEERLQELADSIAANSLLEPIVVRPNPDAEGRFVIIAGERRWRAAQRVPGLTRIPARVLEIAEADAFVLSVAENVNRHDMTVMEEARAYAQLITYGKTPEEIADLFGKRVSTIRERLALVDLDPMVVDAIDAGQVGALLGWSLARLEPGNQRHIVTRVLRGDLDQAQATDLADAMFEAAQQGGFFDLEEPTEEEREKHAKRARQAKSTLDQIERMTALLAEITTQDPAALADALGNDVAARLAALAALTTQATKARNRMRTAKALTEARSISLAEDVA